MASAAMEQHQQQQHQHLYPSKTPNETSAAASSAAAVVAVANLHHNHLLMSYHNRSHHHHHQLHQSDTFATSNVTNYNNQQHYAQATSDQHHHQQQQQQQFHQMDHNHHQQTADGGHAQQQDNQNGTQQQQQHQRHFFNQYVTSYPSYHNEAVSHQHQAYPAAYNATQSQQHSHYQSTFANQQPFEQPPQQHHYQDQYHGFSRGYAEGRTRNEQVDEEPKERRSGSSFATRKMGGHSDADSENETRAHRANESTKTSANTTTSSIGDATNGNNNNSLEKLMPSDSYANETIGLTTTSDAPNESKRTTSKKRPKKSLLSTNQRQRAGSKKQQPKRHSRHNSEASAEDEFNDEDDETAEEFEAAIKNGHNKQTIRHKDNNNFLGEELQLTSSGYSPASCSVESYGTTVANQQQQQQQANFHGELPIGGVLPQEAGACQFTDLDDSNKINSSNGRRSNCNSAYQLNEQHKQAAYARQAATYYNSLDSTSNNQQQHLHQQIQRDYSTASLVLADCGAPLAADINNQHQPTGDGAGLAASGGGLPTGAPSSGSCSLSPAVVAAASSNSSGNEYNQLRILEMRKEKSRDAARSRRSKENHEFYELAKLLPLPAAITSQLDFLDKASIIRLTISFLKLRQFSVNGHPPWAPDFTTLGSVNPYSAAQAAATAAASQSSSYLGGGNGQAADETGLGAASEHNGQLQLNHHHHLDGSKPVENSLTPSSVAFHPPPIDSYQHHHHQQHQLAAASMNDHSMIEKNFVKANAASLFDIHQGTHILQSLDGFAFAIGRDGRFLYISETVSMYLGLSQVEMTGSSVFDYTHQQDHEELAQQLGIPYSASGYANGQPSHGGANYHLGGYPVGDSPQAPASVQSQYSAASSETLIEEHMNGAGSRKRTKTRGQPGVKHKKGAGNNAQQSQRQASQIKLEQPDDIDAIKQSNQNNNNNNDLDFPASCNRTSSQDPNRSNEKTDPLVRQFCIRMKSTLTKRGCQHFKSSGYRVVHVVAHLRAYQSNDHGHLMDPLDDPQLITNINSNNQPDGSGRGDSAASGKMASATTTTTTNSSKQAKRRGPKGGQSKPLAEPAVEQDELASNGDNSNQLALVKPLSRHKQELDESASRQQQPSGKRRSRKIIGMVAVAIALPPPSINELRLESDTFVLRLGLDLKISHVEPKITELLHYPMELLAGHSLYSFVHPADLEQVEHCHRELLRKGQMMSGYYRLLSRTGGYIWIQTCATLICNNTLNASMLNVAAAAAAAATSAGPPTGTGSPVMLANHQQQQLLLGPSDNNTSGGSASRHCQQATPSSSSFLSQSPAGNPKGLAISSSSPSLAGSFTADMVPGQPMDPQQQQQQQQQAQEQCIIFVNYMITNVVERREILDICQSKDFMPSMAAPSGQPFSGTPSLISSDHRSNTNTSNNNNNTALDPFNSPNSTCSSPCLATLKSTGCLSGVNGAAANIINLSSASSGSVAQKASSGRLVSTGGRNCQQNEKQQLQAAAKTARRQSAKVLRQQQQQQQQQHQQQQAYLGNNNNNSLASASENGYSDTPPLPGGPLNYSSPYEGVFQQQQQQQQASYLTQTTDGVNLAVTKHHHHQQQQQQQQLSHHDPSATSASGATTDTWLNHTSQHHHTSSYNQAASNGAATTTTLPYHHNNHQQQQQQLTQPQQQQQQQQQPVVAGEHYWNMDRTSIYKAATFAAANLAATNYSSVAQQAAVAAYHHHHPGGVAAAVGGYSHHIGSHHHHQQAATAAAAAHHHHPHHTIGLASPWDSVSAAVGGSIAAASGIGVSDPSAAAASSLMTSAAAAAAAHHHHHHHHHPDPVVAAAAVHPYSHHHHHHQHPPWL